MAFKFTNLLLYILTSFQVLSPEKRSKFHFSIFFMFQQNYDAKVTKNEAKKNITTGRHKYAGQHPRKLAKQNVRPRIRRAVIFISLEPFIAPALDLMPCLPARQRREAINQLLVSTSVRESVSISDYQTFFFFST